MDRGEGRGAGGRAGGDRPLNRPRSRAVGPAAALLLAVVVVAAAALPAVVTAQSASISMTVDGDAVTAGSKTTVTSDPTVGFEVSAESTIDSVILRVNGETATTWEPGASTLSRTYDTELVDGENEVSVVVQTADGVASQRVTILKDDQGPFIRFTSPFETSHHRQIVPNSTEVNQTTLTLSGEIHDASTVDHITIKRKYQYYHANTQSQSNARWDIENPGDSFAQEIFLGVGSNDITVRVVDTFGQSRDYSIQLNVTDSTDPTVDFDLPNETHGSTLELDGEVRDKGQLDTVSVRMKGQGGGNGLFNGIDKEPEASATRVPLSGNVELLSGENTIVVTATDVAGNAVEAEKTVVYTHSVVPNIRLLEETTTVESDGTIHLEGVVEDGEITGVTIDAVDADSGDVVDLARLYTGPEKTESVAIEESLDLADGRTRVVVRATDTNDAEHQTSFLVNETGAIIWEETDTGATDNESDGDGANESADGSGDGSSTDGSDAVTTAPPSDDGMMSALPLPGFTGVTAAIAMAVIAVIAAVGRYRAD